MAALAFRAAPVSMVPTPFLRVLAEDGAAGLDSHRLDAEAVALLHRCIEDRSLPLSSRVYATACLSGFGMEVATPILRELLRRRYGLLAVLPREIRRQAIGMLGGRARRRGPRRDAGPDHRGGLVSDSSILTVIVERLLFGLVNAQLYGPGSARVVAATEDAATRVSSWCTERGASSVLVGAVDDQVVVEGRPLLGASLFAKRLVQRIRERGAGGVEIQADAPAASLRALLEVLARRGGATDHVLANEELHAKGAIGVRLVPPFAVGSASLDHAPWGEEAAGASAAAAPAVTATWTSASAPASAAATT